MAIDFNKISGESFGDINDIFFKKDGKSILPQNLDSGDKISVEEVSKKFNETLKNAENHNKAGNSGTIIHISKDVIGDEKDLEIELTQLEEKRKNYENSDSYSSF